MINKKINASAMQFALIISVIIAILLSSFLLLSYTRQKFRIQSNRLIKNIQYVNKGMQLAKSREFDDSLILDLNGHEVLLKKKYWGAFEKITASTGQNIFKFQKTALLGNDMVFNETGLYVPDKNLPLVLAGSAILEGETYVPQGYLKPGSVNGDFFKAGNLPKAKMFSSKHSLPELDKNWRDYVLQMRHKNFEENFDLIPLKNTANSFNEKTKLIYKESTVFLNEQLLGNIIIYSEEKVVLGKHSKLDQVLIISPEVTVEDGFRGSVHIITSKFNSDYKSYFQYPSSIVVIGDKIINNTIADNQNSPKVSLKGNTLFEGSVIYLGYNEPVNSRLDVLIGENSKVRGAIYTEGYTELKGVVEGSLYTTNLASHESGSIYINHIYNGKIIRENLPKLLAGLPIYNSRKEIALWLN